MKILAIGDVTSPAGVYHLEKNLWKIREKHGIDMCVVNGENAAFITGATPEQAEILLRAGADVITGGNHTLQSFSSYRMLEECREVLRPVNYGDAATGHGFTVLDLPSARVLVISALGNVHMEPNLNSPYEYIDRVLKEEAGKYDLAVMDVHAEATGEKLALAHFYDGKINVVFGTHTHVPTADYTILPLGTGYVSDLGMCGESGGILGVDSELVIRKMRYKLPGKFKAAKGEPFADGVIFTLDGKRVTGIERIKF